MVKLRWRRLIWRCRAATLPAHQGGPSPTPPGTAPPPAAASPAAVFGLPRPPAARAADAVGRRRSSTGWSGNSRCCLMNGAAPAYVRRGLVEAMKQIAETGHGPRANRRSAAHQRKAANEPLGAHGPPRSRRLPVLERAPAVAQGGGLAADSAVVTRYGGTGSGLGSGVL